MTLSNIVRFFKIIVFEISTSGGHQLSISAFNFFLFLRWYSQNQISIIVWTFWRICLYELLGDLALIGCLCMTSGRHRKWWTNIVNLTFYLDSLKLIPLYECLHWCERILTIPEVKVLTSGSFQDPLFFYKLTFFNVFSIFA